VETESRLQEVERSLLDIDEQSFVEILQRVCRR
jgi:hypothetical protein